MAAEDSEKTFSWETRKRVVALQTPLQKAAGNRKADATVD
jgi:hypothetical protein